MARARVRLRRCGSSRGTTTVCLCTVYRDGDGSELRLESADGGHPCGAVRASAPDVCAYAIASRVPETARLARAAARLTLPLDFAHRLPIKHLQPVVLSCSHLRSMPETPVRLRVPATCLRCGTAGTIKLQQTIKARAWCWSGPAPLATRNGPSCGRTSSGLTRLKSQVTSHKSQITNRHFPDPGSGSRIRGSHRLQVLMDHADGRGAFADGCGHALA